MKRKEDKIDIYELPTKKRGRPFLLGEDLDSQVQAYLTHLQSTGLPVNTAITLGVAEGIVKKQSISHQWWPHSANQILGKRAAHKNGLCDRIRQP